ncbi:MAG: rRNA maturation RNase YbeY [Akkermansia sp.]
MKPNLELYNHLEEGRLNSSVTDVLIGALESCLPSMLALPEGPVPVLSGLDEVEISVVSDDVIRDVHARFLNDPTATDVITFPHGDGIGEIIVSFDTAIRQASEFGEPVFRELFRYMVHGLLHLHGLHRHGAGRTGTHVLPSGTAGAGFRTALAGISFPDNC